MKPAMMMPAGTLDKKPAHGQPCNRCGLCCMATLCPLAQHVFKHKLGPCPALQGDIGSAECGLVANPVKYAMATALRVGDKAASAAASLLIGSSLGCDARMNGEVADQSFYAQLREWDHKMKSEVRRARRLWGMA